ncbi:MAG: hypothetical protein KY476_24740, partial [Planctomycetes bacterium]|nr:hypothetical protein [Planctomycetota bacterium]
AADVNGTWRQLAVVVDGKEVPVGPQTLLIVTDDGYTVTVRGKPYQKGTARLIGDEIPRKSVVVVTEGANAGANIPQISTVQGDVLIACQAAPGEERPTSFTSKPGSGHTLSVWLRVK